MAQAYTATARDSLLSTHLNYRLLKFINKMESSTFISRVGVLWYAYNRLSYNVLESLPPPPFTSHKFLTSHFTHSRITLSQPQTLS